MKPLDLKEFAEGLRTSGDWREADFATEILDLLDLEEEVAEPYSNLCDDLNHYAPESLADKPEKQCEWLGDRSNLLEEIEKELDKDGRTGDTDDQIKEMLETLDNIRVALGLPETATDEDLETAVQELADREAKTPPAMEYDL